VICFPRAAPRWSRLRANADVAGRGDVACDGILAALFERLDALAATDPEIDR
jgi:hypothetical protein